MMNEVEANFVVRLWMATASYKDIDGMASAMYVMSANGCEVNVWICPDL